MTTRTFEVTIECGDEVDVDKAMDKAMFILSDRVWADCNLTSSWAITTTENGEVDPSLSYSFTPGSEEGSDGS